jgi:hypothetical protein
MHGRTTVLRHRLEPSERDELALSLEHALYGLCSQRPNQLVFEIGDAGEETERFKGLVGRDRDGRVSERTADMPLVGDVVQAAELCTWVCVDELHQQLREVRYAIRRQDLDMVHGEIATEEIGELANSARVAVSFDEHKGPDRGRSSHAASLEDVTPDDCVHLACRLQGT